MPLSVGSTEGMETGLPGSSLALHPRAGRSFLAVRADLTAEAKGRVTRQMDR